MLKQDWSKWRHRGIVGRIVNEIAHDPFTAAGLPKVWRYDGWNILDVMTVAVTATWFVESLRGNVPSETMTSAMIFCHWLTILGISRLLTKSIASFVSMLTRIIPVRSTMFDT